MNRNILLGVICSLVFHGSLLWVGSHLPRGTIPVGSQSATLNLSIVTLHSARQDSADLSFEEETRRRVPGPRPSPPHPRPVFAEIEPMLSREVSDDRVKTVQPLVMAYAVAQEKNALDPIPDPQPIWNARVIVKDALGKSEPSSGQALSISRGPSDKGEGASGTVGGDAQVIEAVPDYAVNPRPFYPRRAVLRGQEGTVTLLVEVLPDGSAGEVDIFASSGHIILDRSALKAVRKWRFKPGTKMGKPLTMRVKVPVVYRLQGDSNG